MKTTILINLGNNIKIARNFKNMSQQQLAAMCGFDLLQIQAIELGQYADLSVNDLVKIANVLGFYIDINFTPAV